MSKRKKYANISDWIKVVGISRTKGYKRVEEIFYDGDVWDDFEKELKRIARYEAARYNEKFNNRKIKVLGS